MTNELKLQVTRWIIFALLAAAILIPLLPFVRARIELPKPEAFDVVRNIYDKIEDLPDGSPVILAIDFDPSAQGELRPMALALLRHCFRKNLRVIGMTIWGPMTPPLMEDIFKIVAEECHKTDGVDYALLPFKTGGSSNLLLINQDFFMAYPEDHRKEATKGLPVFRGIKSLRDIGFVVDIAAGTTIDIWIIYGKEKGKMPLAAGCTAVMATDYYPFLQSKQLLGLIGGLNAAYQYEALISKPGAAFEGMKAQTVIHLFLILLIILGNILYFTGRWKKKRE